jgi:tellurite resistance-related uncharacterized protein
MKNLPAGLMPNKRTPEFTELSVPKSLLESHSTKAGTWGKIVVLEGSMTYRILEPAIEEIELGPNAPGVIAPAVKHEVATHSPVRFYIQFYAQPVP